MQRLLLPRSQTVGADGRPISGAKLYTYVTGSSTPKPVWTDAALTIAHANPVEADANGRFPAMFLEAGDYRTVLTDANDVVIHTDDPVDGLFSVADLSLGPRGQSFLVSGNFTVPAGIFRIKVTVTGGGGGGAGCAANGSGGGGGGAGATAIEWLAVTPGTVIPVTVGAAGVGGAAGANAGTNGGDSTFSTFCTGGGGSGGGTGGSLPSGGFGGTATGGDINLRGGDGTDGESRAPSFVAGNGGASFWGGGGRGGASPIGGLLGRARGSGGGGAFDNIGTAAPGKDGAAGIVLVEW
jgi:hypothetical protein